MEETNTNNNNKNNDAQNYEEDYVEEVYDYNIRGNKKKDLGATRFKKIPLYKIDVDTVIPEEPQEKHDKPNDSHYQKELDNINEQIKSHTKNKEELIEKVRAERTGNRPETKEYFDKVKAINTELDEVVKQINKLEADSKVPVEQEKKFKEKRDKLEKEIDVKNYDKLMREIKHYQEQLGFATLSAQEEKKIMDKKTRLESQVSSTKAYVDIKEKIKKLKEENKELFDKLKVLRNKRRTLIDERKEVSTKIDSLKKTVNENNEVINQLNSQITNLKAEIKKLTQQYNNLEWEWNDKWKKFEKYMDIVNYIKEAKKKQHDLIKKEEKIKKKTEKEAKKNEKNTDVEIVLQKTEETKETLLAKKLIRYFNSLLPENENKNKTNENENKDNNNKVSEKIVDDLKKGNLSVFNREEANNKQVLGIERANLGKSKKNKGPKQSKQDKKSNESQYLLLSVGLNSEIKELGLIAPNKKDQIESFIKTLEGRLDELKADALKARNQPKNESSEENKENK